MSKSFETLTTSFYKSELFKEIIIGLSRTSSKDVRGDYKNIYKNILERPKIICEVETITQSEDPSKTFIFEESRSFLEARKIGIIMEFCICNNNSELFTHLVKNYPSELVLNPNFDFGVLRFVMNSFFDRHILIFEIKNIEFLELIFKFYPGIHNIGTIELFRRNFFERHRCDIIELLTSIFTEEQILESIGYIPCSKVFTTSTLDCLQILLKKFPEILSKLDNKAVLCECFEILKIFRFYGCLNKINLKYFEKNVEMTEDIQEFLRDCKHEFGNYF